MGMTTGRATYSYYSKNNDFVLKLHLAFIRTVKNERAGEPASTGNLVQINGIDCIIIKILRNIVVVFCFNCYHSKCHNDSDAMVMGLNEAEVKLWSGRFLLFYFMVTIKHDNTRSLRIKQSDEKYVRLSYAETSFNLHEMG